MSANEADLPKPGDLVRLRSGGPIMTIWEVDSAVQSPIRVEWFVGEEVRRDAFARDELMRLTFEPIPYPKVDLDDASSP